jgi:hypothetical protein
VVTIRDDSRRDDCHLAGRGVNTKTGVAFVGSVRWSVTLRRGTYTFRSDVHETMHGLLRVS